MKETTGLVTININNLTATFVQTGTEHIEATQQIGTSAETFGMGEVGTPGWAWFKNLDDADDVQIGVDNTGFVPFATLEPGEYTIVPLSAAPYGKSLGASPIRVQYLIIER